MNRILPRREISCWIMFLFPLLISLFLGSGVFSAEKGYPDRPINMVVPYGQGGNADLSSKIFSEKMTEFLGQPLISQFKPGGAGSLGAAFVAKAKPDGYTVLIGSQSPLVISPIVKKIDYRLDDFIATAYGKNVLWLAVKKDARWKNLKEFVEEARTHPGKLSVGSYGKLSQADFIIMMLSKQANIQLTHVPYKSSAEALTAVLGGHADGAMVTGSGGLLEAGSVRILACAEEQRLEALPDIPTFREFGYPILISGLYSFAFPKGTPAEVMNRFEQAKNRVFEKYPSEIKEALRRIEVFPAVLNREGTMDKYKGEHELYYKLADELGVVAK